MNSMSKLPDGPVRCDYAPDDRHITVKFRIGVISLTISILSFLVVTVASLVADPLTGFSAVLDKAIPLPWVGLSVGFIGLFQRSGRQAAIVGMAICFSSKRSYFPH